MQRPFLLLAALGAAALCTLPRSETAPAPAGPGALLSTHKQLFAALDRGDAGAAAELFRENPLGAGYSEEQGWSKAPGSRHFLLGAGDAPAEPVANGDLGELLASWSERGGSTRILNAWTDCYSEDLGFAVLEFEHEGADGVRTRYRSTSLAAYRGGGWALCHWHVSPAAAEREEGVAARPSKG